VQGELEVEEEPIALAAEDLFNAGGGRRQAGRTASRTLDSRS
jgi:hypothetical protein